MKAVVVYENVEFAERVDAILRRVASRAKISIEWKVLSWSVDALGEEKIAGKALVQARDARLIVLPAKLARSIPVRLLGWLERWAGARNNPEAALGILDESASAPVETRVHPALSKFAHAHGLDVIRDGSLYLNKPGKLAVVFEPDRQSALPIELNQYGNLKQPGAYRSFGIND